MVNRSRCLWILEWYMNIDYPMDIVCEYEDGQCIFLMFQIIHLQLMEYIEN